MKRLLVLLVLFAAPSLAQDHPQFFITAEREAAWAQMKTDYEANPTAPATTGGRMYKLIKANADSGARYSDLGQWGTWMYHVTGDASYVTKAWTKILTGFVNKADTSCTNGGISGNFSREYFVQHAWMYDWLYPGLDAGQRTAYMDRINLMAACVNAAAPAAQYTLGGDSDQTTGEYMGMAMWYVSTGSYNSAVADLWANATVAMGGLDTTTADYSTYRNAVYRYVTTASAGGEWLEGYEYNLGTVKLLTLGADAIKTATGVDHFPEITAWQQEAAIQYIHTLTPNSGAGSIQPYLWGDTQSARWYRAFYYYETALVLAGVTTGTAAGQILQDWVLDREEASTIDTLDPYPRGFLVFDPYATRGNYTTTPTTRYATGRQMLHSRTGWGASDSWFMAYYPPVAIADHPVNYWGEFQLWKNGKWAFTHPQTYGGVSNDSRGSNGLSFAGVAAWIYSPVEYRGPVTTRSQSSTVNFDYTVATSGGSVWPNHRYGGCASYIMEHTRSLVWLRDWDVIVVYDRANSKATTFPTASLNAAFKTWSESRPRKELYVHTAVSPTQGANYTDWIYDGATGRARVTHLLPAVSTKTVEDETALYTASYYNVGTMTATEKKFHVKIVPDATNQWEPFLNVWDAYGTTPSTVALVEDSVAKAQGALITRGTTNVLTMFNGVQGADVPGPVYAAGGYWDYVTTEPNAASILSTVRLRGTGYEVQFSAAVGSTTKLALFDLNPAATWEYQINGGAAVPLTVGADGAAVAETTATGTVTLTLTATGVSDPVTITTAAMPDGRVGVAYSQAVAAVGGDGGPYDCTLDSGTLPDGLTLDAACATGVTGTPTAPPLPSLTKTATSGWGNAGAYSTNSLAAGDGYVEFTAVESSTARMVGLSNGNTDNNYTDIDYGIYPRSVDTLLSVYEKGVIKYTGTYTAGDVLRVAVVSGAVKYSKNGNVLYTSVTAPTYPLIVDTAFYTQGATVANAVFDDGGGADPVVWDGLTGVVDQGGAKSFTIEACDSTPTCATRTFSLTVRSTPTITTASLDVGDVGESYSDTVVTAGGTAPYSYEVLDGSLPTGLSLAAATGVISGTPTALGLYDFTIRVTDAAADTDDAAFQITINQDPALVDMSITSEPGVNAAVVHFSVEGLPVGTCTVYLKESEATLQTAESTTGPATRTVNFYGLVPEKTYGVEVICGTAQSERHYFTTLTQTLDPGAAVTYTYTVKPHSRLTARGVTKVRVAYTLLNQSPEATPEFLDTACASGCTVSLPFVSGSVYSITHVWLTAADATVASSRAGTVAVP